MIKENEKPLQNIIYEKEIIFKTRVICGIVFKGSISLYSKILFLAKNHGELVYQKITSPEKKLWITEEEQR